MINFVFGISGEDQSPVLRELWAQGSNSIAVPKGMSERLIFLVLKELLPKSRDTRPYTHIAATRNGETRFFSIPDIIYIESRRNQICIVTGEEEFEVYGTLRAIEKVFEAIGFIKIHGSYIISLMHLRKYNGRSVWMDDETVINIGRRYLESFRTKVRNLQTVYFVN